MATFFLRDFNFEKFLILQTSQKFSLTKIICNKVGAILRENSQPRAYPDTVHTAHCCVSCKTEWDQNLKCPGVFLGVGNAWPSGKDQNCKCPTLGTPGIKCINAALLPRMRGGGWDYISIQQIYLKINSYYSPVYCTLAVNKGKCIHHLTKPLFQHLLCAQTSLTNSFIKIKFQLNLKLTKRCLALVI